MVALDKKTKQNRKPNQPTNQIPTSFYELYI